jgi:hypothetical protein
MLGIMNDVQYIQKDKATTGGARYKYVSHDIVTAKIREAMVKWGVFLAPSFEKIEIIPPDPEKMSVLKTVQDGEVKLNFLVTIILKGTFHNVDNPSDTVISYGVGMGIDPQDKATGKAYSYAYKYLLLKTFALETGDDPEADDNDYVAAEKKTAKKLLTKEELCAKVKGSKTRQEVMAVETKDKDSLDALKTAPEAYAEVRKAIEDMLQSFKK